MRKPRSLTILLASTACYRGVFYFFTYIYCNLMVMFYVATCSYKDAIYNTQGCVRRYIYIRVRCSSGNPQYPSRNLKLNRRVRNHQFTDWAIAAHFSKKRVLKETCILACSRSKINCSIWETSAFPNLALPSLHLHRSGLLSIGGQLKRRS
jgi:hypothetical protein